MGIRSFLQRYFFERSYIAVQVRAQADPAAPLADARDRLAAQLAAFAEATADAPTGISLEGRVERGGMLAGLPAERLLALLDEGALTSEALVRHYLHRIRKTGGGAGVLVSLSPHALDEAQAADRQRAARTTDAARTAQPLLGLPILLKDNIATGDGVPTTAGAAFLADAAADRDATLTARLRAAGAIVLGKANLTEWANFTARTMPNGWSALGGQTPHPDGRFDVGGSSSGSCVAVRADVDYAPWSFGTETTGSLVYPASAHGVVTLKPTHGLISRDRIVPISAALDTAGPVARTVRDLALLLEVVAGEDAHDAATAGFTADRYRAYCTADALRGARIGLVRGLHIDQHPFERTGDGPAWERLRAALAALGADAFEVAFEEGPPDNKALMLGGFAHDLAAYGRAIGHDFTLDGVIAYNTATPGAIPYGHDRLQAAAAAHNTPEETARLARQVRHDATTALERVFTANRCDALLTLSHYLSIFHACSGWPALNQPAGKRGTGERVGATWVGRWGEDARIIGYAHALEAQLGSPS
jgi:amidase